MTILGGVGVIDKPWVVDGEAVAPKVAGLTFTFDRNSYRWYTDGVKISLPRGEGDGPLDCPHQFVGVCRTCSSKEVRRAQCPPGTLPAKWERPTGHRDV
jgi:hypothetical protein